MPVQYRTLQMRIHINAKEKEQEQYNKSANKNDAPSSSGNISRGPAIQRRG